jgi:hypothetical protein
LADLLEPGNGETCPAGETDRVTTALGQQNLDVICKLWRHG